ncbi:MAG: hypothetical protein AAF502_20400 [Bacteroidota bacterium]
MDHLKAIVSTLDKESIREFSTFINRMKKKQGRKDLELFEYLLIDEGQTRKSKIEKSISSNTVAYYALRRRLLKHLTDFLVLKQMDNDPTAAAGLMGQISLTRYLFRQNRPEQALYYLRKAEKKAKEAEQFGLLVNIYLLRIEFAFLTPEIDISDVVEQLRIARQKATEEDNASIAFGLIRQALLQQKQKGQQLEIAATIRHTFKAFGIQETILERPKLLYMVLAITRTVYLARKDFFAFEPYIIDQYKAIKQTAFTVHNHFYKLSLLYMIAHVLYRNRKFSETRKYLETFEQELEAFNGIHKKDFYPKYIMLLAAVYNYEGNVDQAIQLYDAFYSEGLKTNVKDSLNLSLNLAVYYFNKKHFEKTNELLISLQKDKWCEKQMGKEWMLKRHIIEMLTQYELGNIEITLNRIRSIERYYAVLFELPLYRRVKRFLKFVKLYITDPEELTEDNFFSRLTANMILPPEEQEDTQTMAFYCWLKSKILKKDYYTILLETVNFPIFS